MASWDWLLKKSRYSLPGIIGFLVVLTSILLILEPDRDFHAVVESAYLICGIPIAYATLLYGRVMGLKIALTSQLFNMIILRNEFVKEWTAGKLGELFVEGMVIPFAYFLICILLSHVILKERSLLLRYKNLSRELEKKNDILQNVHVGIVKALTRAIDAKDSYTRGHSERVACYSLAVAQAAGMSDTEQREVFYAGLLHDIGKIGTSESILLKDGALSNEEYQAIKDHPLVGANIVSGLNCLEGVEQLIKAHHERFDGTGYPSGLKGTDIPLGARIISVVDSYDAMLSSRCYHKAPLSQKEGFDELLDCAGTQFDPQIVNLFIEVLKREIALNFSGCLDSVVSNKNSNTAEGTSREQSFGLTA